MSLINDALKRASQATTSAPPPANAAPSGQALRPVEYKKQAPGWPAFLFPALLMVCLGVGVWIFFRASNSPSARSEERVSARQSSTPPPATETSAPSFASEAAPVKPLAQPAIQEPVPWPQPSATSTAAAQVAPPEQTAALQASAPAPVPVPPPPPTYKLQGIFYRPARPMAMINGLNVLSGEKVGDAQVVSIQPDRVTLSVDGQTKVLTLSQKP